MKKILTLILAITLLMAVSESSYAQKKKKDTKSKVSVHGEKNNDGKFNERKNKGGDIGRASKSKKKKSKKTGFVQPTTTNELFAFIKREVDSLEG